MSITLQEYAANREQLLERIVAVLSSDQRFVAAWLTGSYGDGHKDELSDLDLNIVVADKHSQTLCHRTAQVSAQTTPARFSLFSQFGEIAMLHENNNNAPEGGTFTNTIYAGSALIVDWILIPQERALRPTPSYLLFDQVGIPPAPPPTPETQDQRTAKLSEITAFFWMMTAMSAKYLARGETDFADHWIVQLHGMLNEIKRLLANGSSQDLYDTSITLPSDCAAQIKSLYQLSEEMVSLMPEIANLGGFVRPSPISTLEVLFNFAKEKCKK